MTGIASATAANATTAITRYSVRGGSFIVALTGKIVCGRMIEQTEYIGAKPNLLGRDDV
jgi:hypothetical protein